MREELIAVQKKYRYMYVYCVIEESINDCIQCMLCTYTN